MSPASSALKAKMIADKTDHGDTEGMKEESVIVTPNQENRKDDKSKGSSEGRSHTFALDSEDDDCHENTVIDFIRRSKQRRSSPDVGPPSYLAVSGDDHLQGFGDRSSPRVRFHSRVRITAGMRGRRRLSDGLPSAASSISGSPCSSISAPLRSANTASSKGWGPLGQRVSILTSQSYSSEPSSPTGRRETRPKIDSSDPYHSPPNEQTSLVQSPCRYSYARGYNEDCVVDEDLGDRERREHLTEETFGKWPGRLLNRHWLWWQLEPLVCCLCVNCSDVEE